MWSFLGIGVFLEAPGHLLTFTVRARRSNSMAEPEYIFKPMPKTHAVCLKGGLGATAELKQLLDDGADINEEDECGKTPLWIACRNGEYECAKLLIERGADLNRSTNELKESIFLTACGSTPFHTEIVHKLIAKGCDVNQTNVQGMTPLMRAVLGRNYKLGKALLAAGADPTATFGLNLIPDGTNALALMHTAYPHNGKNAIHLTQDELRDIEKFEKLLREVTPADAQASAA